jgi:hypothetical protein
MVTIQFGTGQGWIEANRIEIDDLNRMPTGFQSSGKGFKHCMDEGLLIRVSVNY